MLYNVVLVSAIQHESAIRIHMYPPSRSSLPTRTPSYHSEPGWAPCVVQQLPISYCTHGSVHMSVSELLSRVWVIFQVALLCPTLWDPMDCSPPGSSVPEILWARILEWVVVPFSRGFSQLRDQTQVSHVTSRSKYRSLNLPHLQPFSLGPKVYSPGLYF